MRAEGTLVSEIREERRHDLVVVSAIAFPTERLMFEQVSPSGVASFLAGVELMKFMGRERGNAKEGMEEDFRVLVIGGENGIDGERGK